MQINDNNFSLFAAKYYDNPHCTDILEFKSYSESGELRERLVLNHLITLFNVFDAQACSKMLVYKLPDHLSVLKSFLTHLNVWPDRITGLGQDDIVINSTEVETDTYADAVLTKI